MNLLMDFAVGGLVGWFGYAAFDIARSLRHIVNHINEQQEHAGGRS